MKYLIDLDDTLIYTTQLNNDYLEGGMKTFDRLLINENGIEFKE